MCPFLQIKIQNQGSRQKLVGLCTDIHNFAICQQNMIHWHTWTLQSITVWQIATPGEGCSLLQKIFEFFLFQNGEFLCMPAWIAVWYFLPFRVMPQAVTNHTDDTTSRIWLKCNSCVLFSTHYKYNYKLCYQFNHVGYNNAAIIAVRLGLRNNSHISHFSIAMQRLQYKI